METDTMVSFEFLTNGCSSSVLADGRSAGFLWKQQFKKSFPSGDNISGIGGAPFKTLNIA